MDYKFFEQFFNDDSMEKIDISKYTVDDFVGMLQEKDKIELEDKYSNANLLNYPYGPIIEDDNYFSDLRYFIEKQCNKRMVNLEIENRRNKDLKNNLENISDFSLALYCFRENFFRYIGKNPIFERIEDYSNLAYEYLKNTYPYCFFMNGSVLTKDMDSALLFYAKAQGASKSELDDIIPMLKNISLVGHYDSSDDEVIDYQNSYLLFCDNVVGTTVLGYQADNLYDTLVKLDDKNVSGFINYLMINVALQNPKRVMNNNKVCCYCDRDGNLLVEEGNHRLMVYKAMVIIKQYISYRRNEGLKTSKPFEVELTKVRRKNK